MNLIEFRDAVDRFKKEVSATLATMIAEELLAIPSSDRVVDALVHAEKHKRFLVWLRRPWFCADHKCHNLNCPPGAHHPLGRSP